MLFDDFFSYAQHVLLVHGSAARMPAELSPEAATQLSAALWPGRGVSVGLDSVIISDFDTVLLNALTETAAAQIYTVAPSSLTSKLQLTSELQAAFFNGTVFTMIKDRCGDKLKALPAQLAIASKNAKRSLHDLYGDDASNEDMIDTVNQHQMLYHSPASKKTQPPVAAEASLN
jgi:hypothetical protein